MGDWSHGYNAGSGYTFGAYRELSPEWLDAIAILSDCPPPRAANETGVFRYMELGCGQGFGLVLLAACYPYAQFVGIDFQADHIAHGRALARAAGLTNIRFIEGDFADMAANWPEDLREFDYVVLHGIYSWISSDLRKSVRECIRQSTVSGGLVYLSYNALPGRLTMLPFQHMTKLLQKRRRLSGPEALREGIGLFHELEQGGSAMNKALATLDGRIKALFSQDTSYLEHEYLNESWDAFWSSEVSADMEEAKLNFLGSAAISDMMARSFFQGGLKELLDRTPDPVVQQDVIDCAINQTFRRDVFVRGRRSGINGLPGGRPDVVFCKLRDCDEAEIRIKTSFSDLGLRGDAVRSLLMLLEEGPRSLAEIVAARHAEGHPLKQILLLAEEGIVGIGRAGVPPVGLAIHLNRAIMAMVAEGAPYRRLAAPVMGGTIGMTLANLLMLHAHIENPSLSADAIAELCLTMHARIGVELKGAKGEVLSREQQGGEAQRLSDKMFKEQLAIWRNLGVFEG